MDYNTEIIELLNKLSSEMCSKIDGIHFEINSMKSAISTLNSKIEKNSKTMDVLCKSISELCKSRDAISGKLDNISSVDDSKITDLKKELKKVDEYLSKACDSASQDNISTIQKLDCINVELKYITHKMLQCEKDLFNIQEKINNK